MARIYKSPENEIAIKLMQNDVDTDALKVAGGDNDRVVLAGGLSPSGAENIHNNTNSDYSQVLGGTSPEEHESSAKKQGMMGKMKDKAKKMKDTVKREFGKSDPSGANQGPLSSPPQEAETGGKSVPVAGNQTPVSGVQTGASLAEIKLGEPQVLGKDFDFVSPAEDAVSGKNEKTFVDMVKHHQASEFLAHVDLHGTASPLATSSTLEPPSEMTGVTPPFEPPLYSHSRKLTHEEPLREDVPLTGAAGADVEPSGPNVSPEFNDSQELLEKPTKKSLQDEIIDLVGTPAKQEREVRLADFESNSDLPKQESPDSRYSGKQNKTSEEDPSLFTGGAFAPGTGSALAEVQKDEAARSSTENLTDTQNGSSEQNQKTKSPGIMGFVESVLGPVTGSR